jgi:hypothetical protein
VQFGGYDQKGPVIGRSSSSKDKDLTSGIYLYDIRGGVWTSFSGKQLPVFRMFFPSSVSICSLSTFPSLLLAPCSLLPAVLFFTFSALALGFGFF